MNIIKINNCIQDGGMADYKGLDLNKIVPGSQLYPSHENSAYFYYNGDMPIKEDVDSITEVMYNECKEKIRQELDNIITPEKRIQELEETVAMLMLGGNL